MIALVDCNNFYASCERVFNPALDKNPVIVLSNNDGCVIARSNEAKRMGIPMGAPAYKMKDIISKGGIQVLSTNFALYGDMSQRVIDTIIDTIQTVEIYSIDEVFIDLRDFKVENLRTFGQQLRNKIKKWTGIPVSVGIAQTKTLSKVANYIAKRSKLSKGVYLMEPNKIDGVLKKIPLKKIWGIGPRTSFFLNNYNIYNAYNLKKADIFWIRHYLNINVEKTVKELNGISCIEFDTDIHSKKSICTSRTFGEMVTEIDDLMSAISMYATRCAEKLRQQKSCANLIQIFITTNPFRNDLPQYQINKVVKFNVPTNDTGEILDYIVPMLKQLYRKGYQYKKAGVIVSGIIPSSAVQYNLFDTHNRNKRSHLLKTIDNINKRMGRDLVRFAIQGYKKSWLLKQQRLSPCYTTRWSDLLKIKM